MHAESVILWFPVLDCGAASLTLTETMSTVAGNDGNAVHTSDRAVSDHFVKFHFAVQKKT